MKIDVYTKAVLTVIAVLLGVIALRPFVSPETASAQAGGFAGVQYGGNRSFFDSRTGDLYIYGGDEYLAFQYKVTKLGQPMTVVKGR